MTLPYTFIGKSTSDETILTVKMFAEKNIPHSG
jgi:hypothetical protein